jgi:predicted  nucleic acid-binding Zn-ribbon protein
VLDGSGDDVDAEILAAKRYRQKKIDRIEELENEVKEVKQERDDLRIRLARQEAEVAALREMLKMKNGNDRSKD